MADQDIIGLIKLLELSACSCIGVKIGVQSKGLGPVGVLDFVQACALGYAKYAVTFGKTGSSILHTECSPLVAEVAGLSAAGGSSSS